MARKRPRTAPKFDVFVQSAGKSIDHFPLNSPTNFTNVFNLGSIRQQHEWSVGLQSITIPCSNLTNLPREAIEMTNTAHIYVYTNSGVFLAGARLPHQIYTTASLCWTIQQQLLKMNSNIGEVVQFHCAKSSGVVYVFGRSCYILVHESLAQNIIPLIFDGRQVYEKETFYRKNLNQSAVSQTYKSRANATCALFGDHIHVYMREINTHECNGSASAANLLAIVPHKNVTGYYTHERVRKQYFHLSDTSGGRLNILLTDSRDAPFLVRRVNSVLQQTHAHLVFKNMSKYKREFVYYLKSDDSSVAYPDNNTSKFRHDLKVPIDFGEKKWRVMIASALLPKKFASDPPPRSIFFLCDFVHETWCGGAGNRKVLGIVHIPREENDGNSNIEFNAVNRNSFDVEPNRLSSITIELFDADTWTPVAFANKTDRLALQLLFVRSGK